MACPPARGSGVCVRRHKSKKESEALTMDSGRQNDLINLLAQFGVNSVPHLQPNQYGAFATALREMGAQI